MSCLLIPSAIIILVDDCGVFMIKQIFCLATNRTVDYNQQHMEYLREKIIVSIMRHQIDLEVTMDIDKCQEQLADGRTPDDESINSVIALIRTRDSQLCSPSKSKRSYFFRTYFSDYLVHLGFETISRSSYTRDTKNAHKWCTDLFHHAKAFVPIHIVNSRFILAVILILEKRIVFYDIDHCHVTANKYRTVLLCYLNKESIDKYGKRLDKDWSVYASQKEERTATYAEDGTYNFCY